MSKDKNKTIIEIDNETLDALRLITHQLYKFFSDCGEMLGNQKKEEQTKNIDFIKALKNIVGQPTRRGNND